MRTQCLSGSVFSSSLCLAGLGSIIVHRHLQMSYTRSSLPVFWLLLVLRSTAWPWGGAREGGYWQQWGLVPANPQKVSFPQCLLSLCPCVLHPAGKQIQLIVYLFYKVLPLVFRSHQGTEHTVLNQWKDIKQRIGDDLQFLKISNEMGVWGTLAHPGLCWSPGGALTTAEAGSDFPTASVWAAGSQSPVLQSPSFRLSRLGLYDSAQASINLLIFFLSLLWEACRRQCLTRDSGAGLL